MAITVSPATTETPPWLRDVLAEAELPVAESAEPLQGRNDGYRIDTNVGAFIVKRLTGSNAAERFERTVAFAERAPLSASPQLVHASPARCAVIFDALTGAVAGNQLLIDQELTPATCAQVGTQLAELHQIPAAQTADLRPTPMPLPAAETLEALPVEAVHGFTGGMVQAWRLIHSDAVLIDRLGDLRERSRRAAHTAIHGDFRIDQVLVTASGTADERVHLVDWEEFGRGDPAYDTGTWIGEWVYRAALDIPTSRGDGVGTDEAAWSLGGKEPSAEQIVRRGVAKLDALSPHILAFWETYRRGRHVSPAELDRAVGFAGWHLTERLLAMAETKSVLSGVSRAAAGIGKRLLTNPAGAVQALGLEPSALSGGSAA